MKIPETPLFNLLAMESSALCNRTCVFCPNHTTKRPDEYMSWDMIKKIAGELRDLKYDERITTYIYNEPMRDERLLPILEYLHAEVPKARLMVSTNGDYIKGARDIEALYDAGAAQVLVNIYSAADGVGNPKQQERGVAIAQRREAQIREWMTSIPGIKMDGKVYNHVSRNSRHGLIEAKYGVTKETQKLAKFQLQGRSGNVQWFIPAIKEPLAKMCVRPWRMLNINWKGDVILCCNDYHGEVVLGNMATDTIYDMWNGGIMNAYRVKMQAKQRDIPLCDGCDYTGGYYQHMVQKVTFGKKVDSEILKRSGKNFIDYARKL